MSNTGQSGHCEQL